MLCVLFLGSRSSYSTRVQLGIIYSWRLHIPLKRISILKEHGHRQTFACDVRSFLKITSVCTGSWINRIMRYCEYRDVSAYKYLNGCEIRILPTALIVIIASRVAVCDATRLLYYWGAQCESKVACRLLACTSAKPHRCLLSCGIDSSMRARPAHSHPRARASTAIFPAIFIRSPRHHSMPCPARHLRPRALHERLSCCYCVCVPVPLL